MIIAVPGVTVALDHLTDKFAKFSLLDVGFVVFSVVAFSVFFWLRLRGLKFNAIETVEAARDSFDKIRVRAEELGWQPSQLDSPSLLIFQVPKSHWSWGEMVVVHCVDQEVRVVSVCFPQLQAIARKKNRENIERVREAVLQQHLPQACSPAGIGR